MNSVQQPNSSCSSSSSSPPSSSSSFNVDKVTLEYFTNKKTYRKYLAKKDPKQSKVQLYKQIESHIPQLQTIFSQLLENPVKKSRSAFVSYNDPVSHLRPKFEIFILSCLEHLENCATTNDTEQESDNMHHTGDDEVMFSEKTCTNIDTVPLNPIEFWKAQQVLKR